jgi:hypothetical protein
MDPATRSLIARYYELRIDQKRPRITALREAMQAMKKDRPHPARQWPLCRDAAAVRHLCVPPRDPARGSHPAGSLAGRLRGAAVCGRRRGDGGGAGLMGGDGR